MVSREDLYKVLNEKVEDYNHTVNAILAFSDLIIHDGEKRRAKSNFGLGRRMTTSPQNKVLPSNDVTPDIVAQKSLKYGVVAEVKKSLSQDARQYKRVIKSLRKYDDDLTGWWTRDKKIDQSDTLMLIHQSRSRKFARNLQKEKDAKDDAVGPTTSVVEFGRSDEASSFFFFRLEYGDIRDKSLQELLDTGTSVPLQEVRKTFPTIRYYDAEPPIALLLSHLWIDVFPSMMDDAVFDESTGVRRISASVSKIAKEIQKAYGSLALSKDRRSGEFPKIKWVRTAFEWLVKHKMALPPTENGDVYTILYKPIRGDVLSRFIKLHVPSMEAEDSDKDNKQVPLFDTEDDD